MYARNIAGCCGKPAGGLGWFAQAMQVAALAASVYQSKSGGDSGQSHCWTRYDNRPFSEPCPNTPNYDAVVRAVTRAPEADIAKIISYLLTTNSGSGPKTRAELQRPECVPFWVKALMGGKGCVASTYPEAPGWFVTFVQTYGAPANTTDTQPGSAWLPGSTGSSATGQAPTSILPLLAAGLSIWFVPKLLGKG